MPEIPELTKAHVDNDKDPFAFLQVFDTVFLIDDSESMKPHWHEVIALICAVVPICCERDHNGIDLYFLNHRPRGHSFFSSVEKSGYRNIGIAVGSPQQSDNVAGIFHQVKPQGRCKVRIIDNLSNLKQKR